MLNMNTWGNKLKLSIFGESHGEAVGVIVDGLPAGEAVDQDSISREMERRAPGRDLFSTARIETDAVEILSGVYEGRTTGAPVCGIIRNRGHRSGDYGPELRPGHADWTALLKYGGRADMRGGGHFSGRLTASLVFAGSLAKQTLSRRGIRVFSRIAAIGGCESGESSYSLEEYQEISEKKFPADAAAEKKFKELILAAKEEGDSVGGVVEAVVFNLPGGLGEPFFGSMESVIASMLFSVPAVKGVEFGCGFRFASMRGSEANDPLFMKDGEIRGASNNNGGILGGISNGMPVVLRAAIKPTPSIAKEQRTVDAAAMSETRVKIRGRHDPCIVPRAAPVIEGCVALCVLDIMLTSGNISGSFSRET